MARRKLVMYPMGGSFMAWNELIVVLVCVGGCVGMPVLLPGLRNNTSSSSLTIMNDWTARAPFYKDLALTASPYSVDPDGLPPNDPPYVVPAHLAPLPSKCNESIGHCDATSPFRTVSGACNNLIHPDYGVAGHLLSRSLPPHYDRGLMRTQSVVGGLLPNPRVISLQFHRVSPPKNSSLNVLLMQMGQFIDHDFSITSVVKGTDGKKKKCLECTSWRKSWCAPVPLPKHDPFISPRVHETGNRRCLPFTRSVAEAVVDASSGRIILQQINKNTAFLDLSLIYGNDPCIERQLRLFQGGLLSVSHREMLLSLPADSFPDCRSPNGKCFFSGDIRANENIGLSVIHLLYHREHNRLAKALHDINPHWRDERLYQEARRLNIAQYQNSVYEEYIPVILGYQTAARHKLIPQLNGYFTGYDEEVNPGVLNEFSTAAFRMGHSQIPDNLILVDSRYSLHSTIPLAMTFHNTTFLLQENAYDYLLRGMIEAPVDSIDLSMMDNVRHQLFSEEDKPHSGQDLFVLNVLRGRDHGLAPYASYVSQCGIADVYSFEDLKILMPDRVVSVLKRIYAHVLDVDLFVGGLGEEHLPGAVVGPTFACIIARQFLLAKRGDRLWYENAEAGFTYEQLMSIRTSSLARTVCDNLDERGTDVPPRAYDRPNEERNPLLECSSLPATDLSLWREEAGDEPRGCRRRGRTYSTGSIVPVSPCLLCVCQPDGRVRCQCDRSGCSPSNTDYYCRKLCTKLSLPHQQ